MADAAATDDRPRWARRARRRDARGRRVAGSAGVWLWRIPVADAIGMLWFPALCALALVGLWRRVEWGRFLFSVVSVLMALVCTAALIDACSDEARIVLPVSARWLVVVGASALFLLPPVVIGWRKRWFRTAAW